MFASGIKRSSIQGSVRTIMLSLSLVIFLFERSTKDWCKTMYQFPFREQYLVDTYMVRQALQRNLDPEKKKNELFQKDYKIP